MGGQGQSMVFQTYSARLVRSTQLTDLTKHLDFEIQGVPRFGFVPGQWLSVKHILPDGEELTRAYSIASPPSENGRVAFCVNLVQDGLMSNFLCDMKDGEELRCQGPFGNFILHPPMRDTIFIATGTGIAPIRSMLHWVLADESRHQSKQLWLIFGIRAPCGTALELSLPADTQPRRSEVARTARLRAGACTEYRRGPQ
jgi:ferredoxin-NADP reductase